MQIIRAHIRLLNAAMRALLTIAVVLMLPVLPAAVLAPAHAAQLAQVKINPDGSIEIKKDETGRFRAEAVINDDARIKFTIDPQSEDILFKAWDVKRLGIDLNTLRYSRTYSKKNGMVAGAPLKLESIELGKINLTDVQSYVLGGDMEESILGLEFLRKLKSYRVEGDSLTLVP